jgi:hypothetical protein
MLLGRGLASHLSRVGCAVHVRHHTDRYIGAPLGSKRGQFGF